MFFKKAFTLMEIIVVIIIIAVLATLTVPIYFNLIEKANNTACSSNQRVLLGALQMYAVDNAVLPATLSQLRDKDLERAWVKEMSEPGNWKKRLAYAISDFNFKPLAYAQPAGGWLKEYLGLVGGPACPNDQTPPPLNSSYGLSAEFVNQPSSKLFNADPDSLIIADSDTEVFDYDSGTAAESPKSRHLSHSLTGSSKFSIAITKGNALIRIPGETPDNCQSYRKKDKCQACCINQFHRCKRTRPAAECAQEKNACKKACD